MRIPRFLVCSLALVGSIAAGGCGSDGPPATTKPGSAFCKLSEKARDVGEEVDVSSDPDDLRAQVDAALEASRKAAAKSPKDFQSIADASIEAQEKFQAILGDHDDDFVEATTSDEGLALLRDPTFTRTDKDRDDYLLDKCEIQPSDNTLRGDLRLAPGETGIRQLFALLTASGTSTIDATQIDCAVGALSGTVSDQDVQALANGNTVTDEGTLAFSQAVSDCGIDIGS